MLRGRPFCPSLIINSSHVTKAESYPKRRQRLNLALWAGSRLCRLRRVIQNRPVMRFLIRFLGFLFAAGSLVFLVAVAAVAGLLYHFSKDLPDYSQLQD